MNNNENIKLKLYKDGEEISLHKNKTEDIEVRKDTAEEKGSAKENAGAVPRRKSRSRQRPAGAQS